MYLTFVREEFTVYWKNIEMAKGRGDRDKLENIYMEVKTEYHHCHKVSIIFMRMETL